MSTKPIYKHDCDSCIFLGTLTPRAEEKHIDCYICTQGKSPNLYSILGRYGRYGNNGPEYNSSLPPEGFADPEGYLLIAGRWYLFALVQAMRKGIIKIP